MNVKTIGVQGFVGPDEKNLDYHRIWDLCELHKIPCPEEVLLYFEEIEFGSEGKEANIRDAIEAWNPGSSKSGFQVNVERLPTAVKMIRIRVKE